MSNSYDNIFSDFFGTASDISPKPATKSSEIQKSINDLKANLEKDFGSPEGGKKADAPVNIFKSFDGLFEELTKDIHGQDDFLRSLIVAFKRPYVSDLKENDPLGKIYITGPKITGRHMSLKKITALLNKRGVLSSPDIKTMDLSLYPSISEEKLFIQDLYSALSGKESVILFENIESCHVSHLTYISSLVKGGSANLSERYIYQKGNLINLSNALAENTVSTINAGGKYLVFISEKPLDKLAELMGAPFVNSINDVCVTKAFDADALQTISQEINAELIRKIKDRLSLSLTVDDAFTAYGLNKATSKMSLDKIINFYGDVFKGLTEFRLKNDSFSSDCITLSCKNEEPVLLMGNFEMPLNELTPKSYNGEISKIKEELDKIVGLKEVKDYIFSLEEYFAVQKRRLDAGLKAGEVNKHMIFTGNPGTGKTTIARIVSKYLKAIGVLSSGQLVEVSRADLVGRYVGHTAPLVNQVIESAIGGVLFIDEAYSLCRGNDDSFGLEAIDTLVKGIEDNRDNLVVILAGYSNEMSEFLESNSGLKSRFPNIIDFPDYTGEELLQIADITASGKGYVIDDKAKKPLLKYFNQVQATRAYDAGNGRLVRNMIEEAILNQSRRLVAEKDADMCLLIENDFEFK